jgi:hypothetical protein
MPEIVKIGERGGIIIQESGRSRHYVSREKLVELQEQEMRREAKRNMSEREKRELARKKRLEKHPPKQREEIAQKIKTAFGPTKGVNVYSEKDGKKIRIRNSKTGRYVVGIVKEADDGSMYLELEKKDGSGKPVAAVALNEEGLERLRSILERRNAEQK